MHTFKVALAVVVAIAFVSVSWIGTANAETCEVGTKTQVKWKGSWYKAKVLKRKPNKALITYDGYGSNWDEWVGPERIKCSFAAASANPYPEGSAVKVKWKKKWWPAKVIGVKENTWKIHYNGYDKSWDEWVGPNRIKK